MAEEEERDVVEDKVWQCSPLEFATFLFTSSGVRRVLPEDIPPTALMVTTCGCHNGCHNSFGLSWGKDGSIKETRERERCAKHAKEGHPTLA